MDTRELSVNHTTSTAHRLTHYDGVCNNIHGHNIEWQVYLTIEMPDTEDAMAIDFKDVKTILDRYDHATLLNDDDPIVEVLMDDYGHNKYEAQRVSETMLGDVVWFPKDPTTENLASHVTAKFMALDSVKEATVEVYETQKYGMSHTRVGEE